MAKDKRVRVRVRPGFKAHEAPDLSVEGEPRRRFEAGEEFEMRGEAVPSAFRDKLELMGGGKDDEEEAAAAAVAPQQGVAPPGRQLRSLTRDEMIRYAARQGIKVEPNMTDEDLARTIEDGEARSKAKSK